MTDIHETQRNGSTARIFEVRSPTFTETVMFPHGITCASDLDKGLFDTWFLMTLQGPCAFGISAEADPSHVHTIPQACLIDQKNRVYVVGIDGIVIPATNEFIPLEPPNRQKLLELVHEGECDFQTREKGPILRLQTISMNISDKDMSLFTKLLKQTEKAGLLARDDEAGEACAKALAADQSEAIEEEIVVVESCDRDHDETGDTKESSDTPAPQKKTVWDVFCEAISANAQQELDARFREIQRNNQAIERASLMAAQVLRPYTLHILRDGLEEDVAGGLRERVYKADTSPNGSHGSKYYTLRRDKGVSVSKQGDVITLTFDECPYKGKKSTKTLKLPAGLPEENPAIITQDAKAEDVCDVVTALQTIVSPGYRAERVDAVYLQTDNNPQLSPDKLRVRMPAWVSQIKDADMRQDTVESIQSQTWDLLRARCDGNNVPRCLTTSELAGVMERCKAEYLLRKTIDDILTHTGDLHDLRDLRRQAEAEKLFNTWKNLLFMNGSGSIAHTNPTVYVSSVEQSEVHDRPDGSPIATYEEDAILQTKPIILTVENNPLEFGDTTEYEISYDEKTGIMVKQRNAITDEEIPVVFEKDIVLLNFLHALGAVQGESSPDLQQDGFIMAARLYDDLMPGVSPDKTVKRAIITTREVYGWKSIMVDDPKVLNDEQQAVYGYVTGAAHYVNLNDQYPLVVTESMNLMQDIQFHASTPDNYNALLGGVDHNVERGELMSLIKGNTKFIEDATRVVTNMSPDRKKPQVLDQERLATTIANLWVYRQAGLPISHEGLSDQFYSSISDVQWGDGLNDVRLVSRVRDIQNKDNPEAYTTVTYTITATGIEDDFDTTQSASVGGLPEPLQSAFPDSIVYMCVSPDGLHEMTTGYLTHYQTGITAETMVRLIEIGQTDNKVKATLEAEENNTIGLTGFSYVESDGTTEHTIEIGDDGKLTIEYDGDDSHRAEVLTATLFLSKKSNPVLTTAESALCFDTLVEEEGKKRELPEEEKLLRIVQDPHSLHLMVHVWAADKNEDAQAMTDAFNAGTNGASNRMDDILEAEASWVPASKPLPGLTEGTPSLNAVWVGGNNIEEGIVLVGPHILQQAQSADLDLNTSPEKMIAYQLQPTGDDTYRMVCLGIYKKRAGSEVFLEYVGPANGKTDYLLDGSTSRRYTELDFSLDLIKSMIEDALGHYFDEKYTGERVHRGWRRAEVPQFVSNDATWRAVIGDRQFESIRLLNTVAEIADNVLPHNVMYDVAGNRLCIDGCGGEYMVNGDDFPARAKSVLEEAITHLACHPYDDYGRQTTAYVTPANAPSTIRSEFEFGSA